MMWWNGSWTWMWIAMVPMMLLMWALIAMVFVPWARSGRPVSPRERLDERLAAGEISVEEHLTRRSELEQLFCPTLDIERQGEHLRIDIDHDEFDRFIDRALQ